MVPLLGDLASITLHMLLSRRVVDHIVISFRICAGKSGREERKVALMWRFFDRPVKFLSTLGTGEQSSLGSPVNPIWAPRGHDLGTGWAPRPVPSFGHENPRDAEKTLALHGHRAVWAPAKRV